MFPAGKRGRLIFFFFAPKSGNVLLERVPNYVDTQMFDSCQRLDTSDEGVIGLKTFS